MLKQGAGVVREPWSFGHVAQGVNGWIDWDDSCDVICVCFDRKCTGFL